MNLAKIMVNHEQQLYYYAYLPSNLTYYDSSENNFL